ncbi:MAG: phenylalanine--tRNA ligase beta subunit-related protein, partial [Pirellulaceae bacterium]
MLVSWSWLQQYVDLSGLKPEEVANRLMLAGLNLESIKDAGSDVCIDLEITSNRPDCLGHIGVAREIAVLFERPLKLPLPLGEGRGEGVSPGSLKQQDPHPNPLPKGEGTKPPAPSPQPPFPVRIDAPDLCPRYTARVIRGIKVKSSPAWMVQRLAAIGQPAINNIVDITNYVLMECGQPLHAFDLAKLVGQKIIVRRAKKNEPFVAIDHK